MGWLDLDIEVLLDPERVPRRAEEARPVSRFPSSDIDLAFVVQDAVPAGSVERTLRKAAGELLESIELFDVYRGPSVAEGVAQPGLPPPVLRSGPHAHRREVGELRARSIAAAEQAHGAVLR